ncbi:hypothetical protein Xen7305DRAFT_00023790 [Xenococcus sp. PCC 7305]|uniref:SirB1 family protein n=1 Tax=Xenococcus sp. PCC 7305 TaxID=102125 RepID=UPI0002AC506F|nr:transglutaminase-like domain-containing protein [Xenococcus sp. PCC 7305]ELS02661.1 hypothetical protein Xen7305DRAFT_00023790 [Xenococcus sp. PCC 7305]
MKHQIGWDNFAQEVSRSDESINLARASLYCAQAEYPELEVAKYLQQLDLIAEDIAIKLPSQRYPLQVIKTINNHLYNYLEFTGNSEDYYNPKNSFLNDVLDLRTGIPLTLAIVYLEIAKRLDFPMLGIGMPGHFLIRPDFNEAGIFVDAFNQGEILFKEDCAAKLQQLYQQPVKLEPRFLAPVTNKQILARMLTNLKQIFLHRRQYNKVLAIITGLLVLFPNNPHELRDRGLLYYELKIWPEASQDLQAYLKLADYGDEYQMIKMIVDKIENSFP